MATTQGAPSFDEIIQAGRMDRERKKAADLANEILGKGRRTSSPLTGGRTRSGGANSLANRISKPGQRATSSSSVANTKLQASHNRDIHSFRRSPFPSRGARDSGVLPNDNSRGAKEFSIKGAAGPYVVVASNFAPGTTSADIQSAMEAIAGEMLSCNIINSYPTVIAEMVLGDKACAETIIATFNNQKADGRLLHVYLKNGPPAHVHTQEPAPPPAPVPPSRPYNDSASQNRVPRELMSERPDNYRSDSTNGGHAEPEVQDGRFGFASKDDEMEMDVEDQQAAPRTDNNRDSRSDSRNGRGEALYIDDRDTRYGFRPGYSRDSRGDRRDHGGYNGRHRNDNRRPPESGRFYSDNYHRGSQGRRYY